MRLTIAHIGKIARQVLDGECDLEVSGVTARGVFLRTPSDRVVFLSMERFRGPLTLNVAGETQALQRLAPGLPIRVSAGGFRPESTEWAVEIGEASLWDPPLPAQAASLPAERSSRALHIIHLALELLGGDARGDMLQDVLNIYQEDPLLESGQPPNPGLKQLCRAVKAAQPEAIAAALEAFYGLGPGLTPMGDDLAIGLLLALNRWGNILHPGLDFAPLNQAAMHSARRKTTSLSANLIESAAAGQADERLILVLDGILCGMPDETACVSDLLDWGSTSGCAALSGMAVAILY